jgi:hypothetical protein
LIEGVDYMVTKFQESDLTGGHGGLRAHQEVSRILTAAVISSHFRHLLLTNPDKAISSGYGGEVFNLKREEKNRIASIRATNLADFAAQLRSMDLSRMASSGLAAD